MVHRKGSRKAHHKGSRKAHRKGSRKAHRQHGGASCSTQPLFNRSLFGQQGGMAPIVAGDQYLIDAASRVQAQTTPLDTAFGELNTVIPRQAGGRRRSIRHHKRSRSAHRRRRSSHRRTKRAQKGGGMAGFNDPYMLGVDIAKSGSNPQFLEYLPAKGAQAP